MPDMNENSETQQEYFGKTNRTCLHWTNLKVGDIIRNNKERRTAMVVQIDVDCADLHILAGNSWILDEDLADWEKVED